MDIKLFSDIWTSLFASSLRYGVCTAVMKLLDSSAMSVMCNFGEVSPVRFSGGPSLTLNTLRSQATGGGFDSYPNRLPAFRFQRLSWWAHRSAPEARVRNACGRALEIVWVAGSAGSAGLPD